MTCLNTHGNVNVYIHKFVLNENLQNSLFDRHSYQRNKSHL